MSSMTNEQTTLGLPKRRLHKDVLRFTFVFFLSLFIVAFGQPDRGLLICSISYVFGYSSILYLLMQLKSRTLRFILAFFWMYGVQLEQLNWLATTTYHGNGILVVYLALGSWFAAHFAILSLFLPKSRNLTYTRCLAKGSLWVLFEVSRLHVLCGFPFNNVGLVLTASPYTMQMAALFGVFGLSFWVILTSAIGVKFFKSRDKKCGIIWASLLMLPAVFGYFHIQYHEMKSSGQKKLDIALIQTGLAVEQKWCFPNSPDTYVDPFDQWKNIFAALQKTGKEAFNLIVLPEVALPGEAYYADIEYKEALEEIIHYSNRLPPLMEPYAEKDFAGNWFVSHVWMAQAIANRFKSELIVGLIDRDDKLEEVYNSAFHFVPFRTTIHRYEKRVLVPLAEYLPLPVMKSFLEKYGITEFFTPGKKAKVFKGEVPLAVSICYEEGYSNLMRESRLLGANLLVNVTNDGWFPKSRLPQEHFNLGVVRAVENGVPIVRACNTGITAAVDSLGRIQCVLKDVDKQGNPMSGIVTTSLGMYTYPTLFSLFGNSLIVLISVVILLGFIVYRRTLYL